jgi:hypothetical protein
MAALDAPIQKRGNTRSDLSKVKALVNLGSGQVVHTNARVKWEHAGQEGLPRCYETGWMGFDIISTSER